MLKIISFKICPFVQRVTALLEAKSLPYEIEYIKISDKPQWFMDISPNGQVPVLITESGIALFESEAIAEYLDETSPTIESNVTPEQRALDRAWSYMAVKNYLAQCNAMRSADGETLQIRADGFRKILDKAEQTIDTGPFFKGALLSNVDIAWLPLLHRANIIKKRSGYDFLHGFPKVRAWQSAVMKTDIVKQSVAIDFEEVFSNFYLSNETYLGNGCDCLGSVEKPCVTSHCC